MIASGEITLRPPSRGVFVTRLGNVFRTSFFYGFQPLFLAIVSLVWWVLPTRPDAPLETAVVLLLVANLAVYLLEHMTPDRADWVTDASDRKADAFWVAARVFVFGPVLQVLMVLSIEPMVNSLDLPTLWPSSWPTFARILLALVVAEFVAFGVHVAMHRVPVLWRYHATHHAQTKLTSARWASNHPIEVAAVQLPIFLLVTVLNPELVDVAGAIIIGRVTVIVAHSNLRLSSRPIGWLLTTPDLHRRHHLLGAKTQANFGDVLLVFDRVFGSFCPKDTDRVGLGAGHKVALRQQLRLRGIDMGGIDMSSLDTDRLDTSNNLMNATYRETVIDLRTTPASRPENTSS